MPKMKMPTIMSNVHHVLSPLEKCIRLHHIRHFAQNSSRVIKPTSLTDRVDPISLHRLEAARRHYYKRRSMYSALGVIVGMAGLYFTAIQAPLPPSASGKNPSTSSSKAIHLDTSRGADDPLIALGRERKLGFQKVEEEAEKQEDVIVTGNSIVPTFPRILSFSASTQAAGCTEQTKYQLLGFGTRTVSFLSISVYILGLYVAVPDISALRASLINHTSVSASTPILSEKVLLANMLRDAVQSEKFWDKVFHDTGVRLLVRIVPVRNTDFAHLRDAWVRTLTARARREGWVDQSFGENVANFKKVMSRGSIPKGQELVLQSGVKRDLGIWYGDGVKREWLGEVKDERVVRAIWGSYLAGGKVACQEAKEKVVEALIELVEKPVGSINGNV